MTRLASIRSRILALAVAGALVPSAVALGIAYTQHRRALESRVAQNLLSAGSSAARATGVWLKEQLFDLRVLAGSGEVRANVNQYAIGLGSIPSLRLREYLRSLMARVHDVERLMVFDQQGRLIAQGAQTARSFALQPDWKPIMQRDHQLVAEPARDARAGMTTLLVAVPVTRADGEIIGAFGAELRVDTLRTMLQGFAADGPALMLVTDAGAAIAGSGATETSATDPVPESVLRRLSERENAAVDYTNGGGQAVTGTLVRVPQAQWSVIAEMRADVVQGELQRFRVVSLVSIAALLALVAWTAYRLGIVIVRPLERLASGAAVVATGDLDVELPVTGEAGEVDALTAAFNNMVRRLRAGRQQLGGLNETLRVKAEELERLSVTDGLTGLANHRALMQRLEEEVLRSRRSGRPFSVIMADVDHFKAYNDEFGHPAGDDVLRRVSGVLKEATRTLDCVARYGGEEFAVLLPETGAEGATEVAERMRTRVAAAEFVGRAITMSFGVAEFPADADTGNKVVTVADRSLYAAKRAGRNCVVRAKPSVRKTRATLAKGRPSVAGPRPPRKTR